MAIRRRPVSTKRLNKLDCKQPSPEHVVRAEFYEHTERGWLSRFSMQGVIPHSSPHKDTDGKIVHVLLEGEQEGVQLSGHDKPTQLAIERGEQPYVLSSGEEVLGRWVLRCVSAHKPEV